MTHQGGRPTKQNAKIEDEICLRIALGGPGSSLKRICDEDEAFPARETVLRWLARDGAPAKRFRHKYARAREAQADSHLDDLIELADELVYDHAEPRQDPEAVAVARLRIDARKFALVKLSPRKYGTRVQVSDADGEPLVPASRRQVLEFGNPETEEAFRRLIHRQIQVEGGTE
jgi:predicted aminopeptidase